MHAETVTELFIVDKMEHAVHICLVTLSAIIRISMSDCRIVVVVLVPPCRPGQPTTSS